MSLVLHNCNCGGRTREFYSDDGEHWYLDPEHKHPIDTEKIRSDDGSGWALVIAVLVIAAALAMYILR